MLTIHGAKQRFCDGIARRSFLKIGAFSFGAVNLSWPTFFARESRAASRLPTKPSSISSWAAGRRTRTCGTSRPKLRRKFAASSSRSARTCRASRSAKCFPKIAAMADKFAFIRSVVGARGGHDADAVHDRPRSDRAFKSVGGRPSIGAILSKLRAGRSVGAAVRRPGGHDQAHALVRSRHSPAFWAPRYAAFKPDGPGHGQHEAQRHHLDASSTTASNCCRSFDQLKRDIDISERDARRRCRHRTGARRADLEQTARRPRPEQGDRERCANATATASHTSSSTTAPRR